MSWNISVWLSYLLTLHTAKSLNYNKIAFLLVKGKGVWVGVLSSNSMLRFSIGLGSPEEITFQ